MIENIPEYGRVEDEHGNVVRWGPRWVAAYHKDDKVQIDIIEEGEEKEVNCPIRWKRKEDAR